MDGGRRGTGVNDWSGLRADAEALVRGDWGIVLNRSIDETDPLARKIEVSNEVSGPSGKANDKREGEGSSIEDS